MKTLWDWSSEVYSAPGVAEACLHLQDEAGQNVPLLLWAAWMARTGRSADADTLEAACDMARAWTDTTIVPLRVIRRAIKSPIPDMGDLARELIRDRIKAVELEAEKHLLAALEQLAPPPDGAPKPAIDGLVDTARLWSRVVPRPALTALAERLPA
ncbi:TIGR02444 family protein [Brevundimonas variabilis]|uniref:Uncharacterized protein (TIGR02444 family) n=1 Tax=Brevundimonas variabilis TaxID=74312 RepID=A0A7W9CIS7_9CAUL|nr:TIGR02444 family protein [Brevundimonas variabilis]MBB5746407.1 uncharacterized protein (TIGR02444 family) [Brevundimonas variabilis]